MDSNLVSIIFCVLIGLVLVTPMVLARRRAPEEQGVSPVFETFCSGRIGAFAGSYVLPIFRLSIYKDFLVICCIKPRVIPFTQLIRAEARKELVSSQLYLEQTGGTYYLLSVRNPDKALAYLKQ